MTWLWICLWIFCNVFFGKHCLKSVQLRFHAFSNHSCFHLTFTAWKVSKYGVSLVRIFPYRTEYWISLRISPYSVRMRENMDQKKLRIWTLFMQWRSHKNSFDQGSFSSKDRSPSRVTAYAFFEIFQSKGFRGDLS